MSDGGAAFPVLIDVEYDGPEGSRHGLDLDERGMSLRDYFAAHAPPYPFKLPAVSLADKVDPQTKVASSIAEWRFAFADAMLAAQNKETSLPGHLDPNSEQDA